MSELLNVTVNRNAYRRHLLATASAFVFLMAFSRAGVKADDSSDEKPSIWIELGGQLESNNVLGQKFDPSFLSANLDSPPFSSAPFKAQNSRFSIGGEGKISFQPEGSDWVFAVSGRYGRASSNRHIHQSKGIDWPKSLPIYNSEYTQFGHHSADTKLFSDTVAKSSESHAVVDFQAGKDFGLGIFGTHSISNVSLGVRFAQFSSGRDVMLRGRPDLHFYDGGIPKYWHTYGGHELAKRSFRGIGPALSWSNATSVLSNRSDGELTLDWGVNAAVLFGRQKAAVQHVTTSRAFHPFYNPQYSTTYQPPAASNRMRFVAAPNAGAFAGLSIRYSSARVSLGYRGDFFFGAMDAGNDTRKSENTGFYGPFVTISVGIGG